MDIIGISVGSSDALSSSAQADYANAQSIAIGSSATQTQPFTWLNTVVSLRSNVACWFSVGASAAAHVAGSDYLPANQTWMLKIPQGAILSFIQDTVAGWVSVTPMVNPVFGAIPAAVAAYSLRQLYPGYTGTCITVRRASDNTTSNIGFVGGNLDTATLNTFINATTGFVVTWFDQSGNGRNATQATNARQPQIFSSLAALNNRPALLFGDNSAINLGTAAGAMTGLFTGAQPAMISSVCNINTFPPASNDRLWGMGGAAPNTVNFYVGASFNQALAGWNGPPGNLARWQTNGFGAVGPHAVDVQFRWVQLSDNAVIWYDGTQAQQLGNTPPSGTPGSDAGLVYYIGSNATTNGWPGHISEQICWQSPLSAGAYAFFHASRKAYWGTP